MVNFNDNLYFESYSFKETKALRSLRALSDVPTSKQISGIEVRLSRVHIRDNKTAPLGPFPGLAKVYLMNIIASDILGSDINLSLEGFEKVDDKYPCSGPHFVLLEKNGRNPQVAFANPYIQQPG